MSPAKRPLSAAEKARLQEELRRDRRIREQSYRIQALKLFPHLCASCGREFSGKRLKELTVHHRDHDHTNNPPDGSNWELLCIYCHDNEHEDHQIRAQSRGPVTVGEAPPPVANPFDALDGKQFR
jgi:5-methylcytosine-specific restriction endonuclease McrA